MPDNLPLISQCKIVARDIRRPPITARSASSVVNPPDEFDELDATGTVV